MINLIEDNLVEIFRIVPQYAYCISRRFHTIYEQYIHQIRDNLINSRISNVEIVYIKKILEKLNKLTKIRYSHKIDCCYDIIVSSYNIPILHKLINYVGNLAIPGHFSINPIQGFIYHTNPSYNSSVDGYLVRINEDTTEYEDKESINLHVDQSIHNRDNNNLIEWCIEPGQVNWLVQFMDGLADYGIDYIRLIIKLGSTGDLVDICYAPDNIWTGYNVDEIKL